MTKLNPIATNTFKTSESCEDGLEMHNYISSGIWMKIWKKDFGKKTITYSEALDVALCSSSKKQLTHIHFYFHTWEIFYMDISKFPVQ